MEGGGCCMGGVLDVICAARTSSRIVIGIDGWLSLAAQRSALVSGWGAGPWLLFSIKVDLDKADSKGICT